MAETPGCDVRLSRFLAAPVEQEADLELGRILATEAAPLIERVVRAQLADLPAADREDVGSGALLRLTETLRALRAGRSETPIESLEAYTVATARNACRAFLRARRPEHTRLGNQVRYLLGHDDGLATWEGRGGVALAGLATWRARDRAAPAAAAAPSLERAADQMALGELLRRLLLHRGGPWPVVELVAALAALRGVRDRPPVALAPEPAGEEESAPFELAEGRPGQDRELEDRQFLALVWAQVRDLPRRQRVALLLNLRDAGGGDMLSLFPATDLARPREIARLLELPLEELEALWERLPLEDREIADLLDATPRQVINLRKSARERLARRMLVRAGTDSWRGR